MRKCHKCECCEPQSEQNSSGLCVRIATLRNFRFKFREYGQISIHNYCMSQQLYLTKPFSTHPSHKIDVPFTISFPIKEEGLMIKKTFLYYRDAQKYELGWKFQRHWLKAPNMYLKPDTSIQPRLCRGVLLLLAAWVRKTNFSLCFSGCSPGEAEFLCEGLWLCRF